MENLKKVVIFGENNSLNIAFYNSIKKLLMINDDELNYNLNNYLETFFNIQNNKYLLISSSPVLLPCKDDNDPSKEEKKINQELLLSSDIVYLLIDLDNVSFDYNLTIQKYLIRNKKKSLVIFSSNYTSESTFRDNFLTSIPLQRIVKCTARDYYFFSSSKSKYSLSQLKKFVYDEFLFDADSNEAVISLSKKTDLRLTIFGTPNSGKSTLLNSLLGRKRSIVSPLAGTTREDVISLFEQNNIIFKMKDTEGVSVDRRNDYSILSDCQISWVILDSTKPVTKKILQIISLAEKCNCAVTIILNKIDIASVQQIKERKEEISLRLKSFSFVPIISISALKKNNFFSLLTVLEHTVKQSQLTFGKALLAQQFSKLLEKNPPAAIRGKHLKIYYALHERGFVHKFIIFVNNPQLVHFSYHRYIVNYLRKNLEINSLPLRLFFKKS